MTEAVSETALQTSPSAQDKSSEQTWKRAEVLPCRQLAGLRVAAFPARDLFRLNADAVTVTEFAR